MSSFSQSQEESNEENTKLRNVIRQLYKDKQDLKELLNEANQKVSADDFQIVQEENSILKSQILDLQTSLRITKTELHDSNLNLVVAKKEVEQFKITLSSLEEELTIADSDRLLFSKNKIQISQQEDEIRNLSRKVVELESNLNWKEREISKLQNRPIPILDLSSSTIFSQNLQNQSNNFKLFEVYQKIEKKEIDEKEVDRWLESLPSQIENLKEENQSLIKISSNSKKQFAKLQNQNKGIPSQEKLSNALKLYIEANEAKKLKIQRLKEILLKQSQSKSMHQNFPDENLVLSLRKVIHEMATCKPNEREKYLIISDKCLGALLPSHVQK